MSFIIVSKALDKSKAVTIVKPFAIFIFRAVVVLCFSLKPCWCETKTKCSLTKNTFATGDNMEIGREGNYPCHLPYLWNHQLVNRDIELVGPRSFEGLGLKIIFLILWGVKEIGTRSWVRFLVIRDIAHLVRYYVAGCSINCAVHFLASWVL